jgi:hypothetical protein
MITPPVSVIIGPLNPPISPFWNRPFSISAVKMYLNSSMRTAEKYWFKV